MPADMVIAAPPERQPGDSAASARYLAPAQLPLWRARLERRWRARLDRVTRLSLAYHDAEQARGGGRPGNSRLAPPPRIRLLLRRAVAERRKLAEIEAALSRLASGGYGLCELCREPIARAALGRRPEARYCEECQR